VEVDHDRHALDRNRVRNQFHLNEGEVAKIQENQHRGQPAFTEDELLNVLQLRTPRRVHPYFEERPILQAKTSGRPRIAAFVLPERGYLEFNIDSTQVSITPDRHDNLHHDQHTRARV